jgi:hypothetical protein
MCTNVADEEYACNCAVGWEGENCDDDVDNCVHQRKDLVGDQHGGADVSCTLDHFVHLGPLCAAWTLRPWTLCEAVGKGCAATAQHGSVGTSLHSCDPRCKRRWLWCRALPQPARCCHRPLRPRQLRLQPVPERRGLHERRRRCLQLQVCMMWRQRQLC